MTVPELVVEGQEDPVQLAAAFAAALDGAPGTLDDQLPSPL